MTATATGQPLRYHWILTLRIPDGAEYRVVTGNGIHPANTGATRSEVYAGAIAFLAKTNPAATDRRTSTLFFALEPDQL